MEALLTYMEVKKVDTGAVIIAADRAETVLLPAGGSTVAQRMISTFQKAGVGVIAVITGPQDKKLEKQLSRPGVLFLKNPRPYDRDTSLKLGLEYMRDKCERVFLLDADRPLLQPETLEALLNVNTELAIPSFKGRQGMPLLLSAKAVAKLCTQVKPDYALSRLERSVVPVDDEGIVLSAVESESRKEAFIEHDKKISRFVLDLAISRDKPIVDAKLINLLSFVEETQSVREACSRMQISYSTAWNMLNSAEEDIGYSLIERNKGGASGAGSMLTEKGGRLLKAYCDFNRRLSAEAKSLYADYFENLL